MQATGEELASSKLPCSTSIQFYDILHSLSYYSIVTFVEQQIALLTCQKKKSGIWRNIHYKYLLFVTIARRLSRITHLFLERRCRKYFCGSLFAADFYALLVQRRQRSAATRVSFAYFFSPD